MSLFWNRFSFTRCLRFEAVVCVLSALAAFAVPAVAIRFLAQAPLGSFVGWLDVVVLVRAIGCAHLVLAAIHLLASRSQASRSLRWLAGILRAVAGVVRWHILLQLPAASLIAWIELALAGFTVLALLRSPTQSVAAEPAEACCSRWPRLRLALGVFGLSLLALIGWRAYALLLRAPTPEIFATEEAHFKYGGLTNQKARGLPLYIFEALPEVFPDLLRGTNGWQSFGLLQEPNRAGPVGWTVRTNGFPHLLPNCALCHTATYRVPGDDTPRLIVGGAALQLDFQALFQFLFACARDSRFTDGSLLKAIQRRHALDAATTALYERLIIPTVAGGLRLVAEDFAWMNRIPPPGPGRFDAGAMLKFNLLRLPYDSALSTTDMLPVWDRRAEQTMWQRWTGGGKDVHEEMLLSAGSLAALVPEMFDEASFNRYARFLETLPPPKYPLPIQADLAARGKTIFTAQCAECHAPGGKTYGRVTSLREIGTDPEVLAAYDARTVAALHALKQPPLLYPAQQQTDGYKNVSLAGLWARAPYLHNGSVPTLWDLLQPPGLRPATFARGGNVLDPKRLGFEIGTGSTVQPFLFDTRLRGNSNAGHTYAVDLPEVDKIALIEFLKSL